MLKKMRWRLILTAMLAFFAVVVLTVVMVNLLAHYIVTGQVDQTLSYIAYFEEGNTGDPKAELSQPSLFNAFPDAESYYATRFFIVRFDEGQNVVSTFTENVTTIDEAEAERLARTALEKDREKGFVETYRYAMRKVDGGTTVVFLNAASGLVFTKWLHRLSIYVALASLALAFVLVYLFSGKAIRPIARNMEQQKQFITDASHELKTPLTSIAASIDVISLEYGDDEWTDNIRAQSERMTRLVGELVTLSRLDEELTNPVRERFSVSNAAWEIMEIYRPQAKAVQKQFDVDIQEDVMLHGNQDAVQRMLSVLLDNAIRYSDPEGKIRLDVAKKRGKVWIEVFNTCRFETPPDVERLFDRFYRPDESRSTETGGTGVGLAIAKAVAEAHNGTITASCPDGKTMTITAIL